MSQQRREFEAHAESVDEAISIGLAALDLKRDEVTIKVLDEGSRGLLGIGSRNAVVRLTAVNAPIVPAPVPAPDPIAPEPEPEPVVETAVYEKPVIKPTVTTPTDEADEPAIAREVVAALLQKMGKDADVTIQESDIDDKTGRVTTIIDVRGENLNALIGSRGETLAAIQYIARLIVANRRHERAHFVIDIDGYRQKREKAVARLAERMANKVMERQEAISLEPMSPADRRIIHITLRDMDGVYTESVGEGSDRKVRIFPE